ncbi:non-lysosomal glucosylceramidase [Jannaschia sp. S6380]|uniref:GH116 family glycosyl hydrolase n=1 Tax=Jannaschia sp. S6380 TaxID=2926408 RepID=UPI001FF3ED19|nr:GH116 family glycosyl hydrolase [Jannaschia sp. S6380]MCK0167208.1 non-lysosomal glucosylceramidase [Jannaschia sp. S6380]
MTRSQPKTPGLFAPIDGTGVPLGGIGTGGITRASDGRFTRWTIKGGGVRHMAEPANGFVLRVDDGTIATARALQPAPPDGPLGAFEWEVSSPAWAGLFPFAWHDHAALSRIAAECLSFSPVAPGDMMASVLPVALFRWRLTNGGSRPADVTLAFLMANMNGRFGDFGEGPVDRVAAGLENRAMDAADFTGVILDRRRTGDTPPEGDGEWGLAVRPGVGLTTGRTVCFDARSDGAALWRALRDTGDLPRDLPEFVTEGGFREVSPGLPAGAVSARMTLAPGESREVDFALAWDLPVITFGQGRRWWRSHTDDWGRDGHGATALCEHALSRADDWQRRIAAWHDATAERLGPEPHRAGMALNELYFLVDGLTVLTSARDSPDGRAHFGLIECHDYALYDTLDLWIYAAEAVALFEPALSAMVSRDFAAHLLARDPTPRLHQWTRETFALNPAGSCPHDLGGPGEDPFVTPNAYTYRDATVWKDLNCDLVLCLWRDGERMGADWRRHHFPAVAAALDHLQRFDRDGDGLIENDGTPDQTFDNIPMSGPSSYCGGLWIAALLAGARMAAEAGEAGRAADWSAQAEAARESYAARLFDGTRFRVDTDGPFSDASFIEGLLGPFLARRFGLGDVVSNAHARASLRSVFARNFEIAGRGMGAVSLADIPPTARHLLPHADDRSFQTSEIQPGFNFSFAAQLEEWDLRAEADTLRRALYRELHERRNLAFQSPAAFDVETPTARAILNMRPLSIWWMT